MIIIAESGSTKTDWRIMEKGIVQSFQTVGLNPHYLKLEEISEIIKTEIKPNINAAISAVYFYGTGVNTDQNATIIKTAFYETLCDSNVPISVKSDIDAAAISVLKKSMGLVCILGTGSNSCLWNGEKIIFQVPPLGFWLGDEGSGAHLGKLLILSYLHKEMPENIRTLFEAQYGNIDRLDVLANSKELPSKYFASFSIFIFKNKDDAFIANLIKTSFNLFFEKYISKYPPTNTIGFAGSIGYFYEDFLKELCKKYHFENTIFVKSPIDELVKFHGQLS